MRICGIYFLSLLLFCFACEEVDFSNICDVSDPASELEWLKEKIEDSDNIYQNEMSYFSFIFEESIYIQDSYCGNSFILWSSSYFDCKGKEKSFSTGDLEKISLLEKKLIWKGGDCD